jgi:hypothetical protein
MPSALAAVAASPCLGPGYGSPIFVAAITTGMFFLPWALALCKKQSADRAYKASECIRSSCVVAVTAAVAAGQLAERLPCAAMVRLIIDEVQC